MKEVQNNFQYLSHCDTVISLVDELNNFKSTTVTAHVSTLIDHSNSGAWNMVVYFELYAKTTTWVSLDRTHKYYDSLTGE